MTYDEFTSFDLYKKQRGYIKTPFGNEVVNFKRWQRRYGYEDIDS